MSTATIVYIICAGVAAAALIVIAVFVVLLCCSLMGTNRRLKKKLHMIDPYTRIVEHVGDALERRMQDFCEDDEWEYENEEDFEGMNTLMEAAEWALLGKALWKKITR